MGMRLSQYVSSRKILLMVHQHTQCQPIARGATDDRVNKLLRFHNIILLFIKIMINHEMVNVKKIK